MESFAAKFPHIYADATFKGWFTSTLLLAAWFGSLVNGPIADRIGRKGSILLAVVIFTVGSALQAGAESIPMLFTGAFFASSPPPPLHTATRFCVSRKRADKKRRQVVPSLGSL